MITIHKYKIEVTDEQIIKMPVNAKPLHVNIQDSEMYIWAVVDTAAPIEPVTIRIAGTGHDITNWVMHFKYIGTVHKGPFLVWHVYY